MKTTAHHNPKIDTIVFDLYRLTEALIGTVCIIDICSSIDNPNATNNRERFTEWYKKYLPEYSEQYDSDASLRLTADRCYKFKCKLLHEGRSEIEREVEGKFTPRAVFSIGGVEIHNSVSKTNLGTYFYVSIEKFMNDVISGIYMWLDDVDGDERVDEAFEKLIKRMNYDPGRMVGGQGPFFA